MTVALLFINGCSGIPTGLKAELSKLSVKIYCADSGAAHALRHGFKPDLLIGDFDSIPDESLSKLRSDPSVRIEEYPADKAKSDLELVAVRALNSGVSELIIACGLGGSLDHLFSNILLFASELFKTMKVTFIDETSRSTILHGPFEGIIDAKLEGLVSLVPLSKEVGKVFLRGTKWALSGETLHQGDSRSIRNTATERKILLQFESGVLMIHREV